MFNQHKDIGYTESLPGIMQKTLVFGEKTLMVEFILTKGAALPLHAHPYEQTGYLVKGHIRLKISDKEFDAHEGDSWSSVRLQEEYSDEYRAWRTDCGRLRCHRSFLSCAKGLFAEGSNRIKSPTSLNSVLTHNNAIFYDLFLR